MTRSEAIQEAIAYFETEAGFAKEDAELMERCGPFDKLAVWVARRSRNSEFFNNTIKSVLLAEQKRSEGCDLCVKHSDINQFSIDDGLLVDHSDYGDNNSMPAHFCLNCGRDLTEGESV